jgi:hypothetical protein
MGSGRLTRESRRRLRETHVEVIKAQKKCWISDCAVSENPRSCTWFWLSASSGLLNDVHFGQGSKCHRAKYFGQEHPKLAWTKVHKMICDGLQRL